MSINKENNTVTLGRRSALYSHTLIAGNVNLFIEPLPSHLTAKVRYSQSETPCKAEIRDNMLRVEFQEQQEAVTRGQSVVLYHQDFVAGGGIIEDVI